MVKFVYKFVFFWNPNEISVFILLIFYYDNVKKIKFSYYLVKYK